jgi:hypothetical protein
LPDYPIGNDDFRNRIWCVSSGRKHAKQNFARKKRSHISKFGEDMSRC